MEIYAKGKNIPTYTIAGLFRQGEKYADTIRIITDRYYCGKDLSKCSFIMRGVNANKEEAQQALIPEVTEYTLVFNWKVSEYFTAVAGILKLELRASETDADGGSKLILKYSMEPVVVAESPIGLNLPIMPSVADQIISGISSAATEGAELIDEKLGEITELVLDGKTQIQKLINGFDISAVEQRLDDMDSSIGVFLGYPRVMPVTMAQYALMEHQPDVLYVIVKE